MRNTILLLLFIIISLGAAAQKDTLAIMKKFEKIMAFNDQPELYYSADISVSSSPVMYDSDNMNYTSELYRDKHHAYYRGAGEEVFAEDSLLFRVNTERKSVWVSKEGAEFIGGLARKKGEVFTKDMTANVQDVNIDESGSDGHITLVSKPSSVNNAFTSVIQLLYNKETLALKTMEIIITMKQPADEELMELLKKEKTDISKDLVTENGEQFFYRSQTMKVDFKDIETKAPQTKMPAQWSDRIMYTAATGTYKGIGAFADYEVTKLY